MKKTGIFILVLAILVSGGILALQSEAQTAEVENVKIPLNNYIQGHATGNSEFIRKAFHADAKIIAIAEGKLFSRTVEEFAKVFSGKPAADEAQRKRAIENIEITGNVATAKIVLDYPAVKFTDHMSLVKIDGEWKIINKTYYAEQKTAPAAKSSE